MNPASQSGEPLRPRNMSSGSGSAALRPRPKRLISLDDPPIEAANASADYPSPFGSRAASPIPSKHPSRSSSTTPAWRNAQLGSNDGSSHSNDFTASFQDLWGKSWTSIQTIASSVLGSDASSESIKDKGPQRRRRPFEATHTRGEMSPNKWGPSTSKNQPGAGSLEERKAIVRAKKREELLAGNGNLYPNSLSARYKRRSSDEFESTSAPPGDQEDRDALVYIHHVTPQDTLPGISIKFNCQLAVLKKANRMWSNDSIQTRKVVMLPVDECGVKGRPVPGPSSLSNDLLADDIDATPTRPSLNTRTSSSTIRPGDTTTKPTETSDTTTISPEEPASTDIPLHEPTWKHDSWVLLDGQFSPIEIARLPRRELGFFPRVRRNSLTASEFEPSASTSFDLPSRPSITISDTGESRSVSKTHRHRRSSSSHHFAQQMVGPGGVGNLVGKGPSAPGPSEDKFTRVFSKHFPNILPPPPPPEDNESRFTSGTSTPALNVAGLSGLENIGGAVEGWFRSVTSSALRAVDSRSNGGGGGARTPATATAFTQGSRRKAPPSGRIEGTASGDLIELSNAFEVGEDDEEEDDDDVELTRRLEDDTRRGRRPPRRR